MAPLITLLPVSPNPAPTRPALAFILSFMRCNKFLHSENCISLLHLCEARRRFGNQSKKLVHLLVFLILIETEGLLSDGLRIADVVFAPPYQIFRRKPFQESSGKCVLLFETMNKSFKKERVVPQILCCKLAMNHVQTIGCEILFTNSVVREELSNNGKPSTLHPLLHFLFRVSPKYRETRFREKMIRIGPNNGRKHIARGFAQITQIVAVGCRAILTRVCFNDSFNATLSHQGLHGIFFVLFDKSLDTLNASSNGVVLGLVGSLGCLEQLDFLGDILLELGRLGPGLLGDILCMSSSSCRDLISQGRFLGLALSSSSASWTLLTGIANRRSDHGRVLLRCLLLIGFGLGHGKLGLLNASFGPLSHSIRGFGMGGGIRLKHRYPLE